MMLTRLEVQQQVEAIVTDHGLTIVRRVLDKPWGFEFFIDESQTPQFIEAFFPEEREELMRIPGRMSPKILSAFARLSWQDHQRRAELHRVLWGPAKYILSPTDDETEPTLHETGELIRIPQGMRHRFTSGSEDSWTVIAEIWQHTDPLHHSGDDDIRRISDDHKRT